MCCDVQLYGHASRTVKGEEMSSKIRAYIGHSIRGKFGVNATDKQRDINSKKAIDFGNQLSTEFPNIDFYIPGLHQEFDCVAERSGYLIDKQILDIDCTIISRCNFLIVFSPDDYISKGMQIEIDHAVFNNTPVISAVDGSYDDYFKRIVCAINCHLTSMMR